LYIVDGFPIGFLTCPDVQAAKRQPGEVPVVSRGWRAPSPDGVPIQTSGWAASAREPARLGSPDGYMSAQGAPGPRSPREGNHHVLAAGRCLGVPPRRSEAPGRLDDNPVRIVPNAVAIAELMTPPTDRCRGRLTAGRGLAVATCACRCLDATNGSKSCPQRRKGASNRLHMQRTGLSG
jgi:hypothetical protein